MTGPAEIARIAEGLTEVRRALILALPEDVYDDAGMISWRINNGGFFSSGPKVAFWAREHNNLIERKRSIDNTKFVYRLTPLGLAVRAHLEKGQIDE